MTNTLSDDDINRVAIAVVRAMEADRVARDKARREAAHCRADAAARDGTWQCGCSICRQAYR